MTRADFFLWVVLPYLCIAVFAVGHVWHYRRDQYTWTARSTQLLERRLLRPGSLLFHFGILAAIGGHLLGILVPRSWTEAVGISDDAYHWISVLAGTAAGIAIVLGLGLLLYRRASVPRVRVTTSRSDLVLYPVLGAAILFGALATFLGNDVDRFAYRETVSPWFRGIFTLDPKGELMADASFVFQAHAVSAWLLFAVWPFTRLVHAWSVPLAYLRRTPVVYRRRGPAAASRAAGR